MAQEVLIIGGGVIGLSIACELAMRGERSVSIIDKGRCGEEASWAAAGMLSPQVDADEDNAFFRLCCESRDAYPAFIERLESGTGVSTDFDQTGTIFPAFSDREALLLERRYDWQTRRGLDVANLDANEIREIEPELNPAVLRALLFPRDWQINSRKLFTALKLHAEAQGVKITENTSVEHVTTAGSRVTGIATSDGSTAADEIVVATGAWSSLIDIGGEPMPFTMTPIRGQIVAFRPNVQPVRHVVYGTKGYVLPRPDGQVLAGATSEDVGFDKSTTGEARSGLQMMAASMIPTLQNVEIADQWSGLRPRSSDDFPLIGDVGIDGLTIATGHYRNGILLAPITAKIVADMILSNNLPQNIDQFSPRRFSAGRASLAKV